VAPAFSVALPAAGAGPQAIGGSGLWGAAVALVTLILALAGGLFVARRGHQISSAGI
jgi:hypothetical protein